MIKRIGFLIFIILVVVAMLANVEGVAQRELGPTLSDTGCKPTLKATNNNVSPETVGMDAKALLRIDSIARDGIKNAAYPGCQILIMKEGKTVYNKQFGHYSYDKKTKVSPTTLYDLASLTKTTATLMAIMKLYDEQKLSLTDKASDYLPFLKNTDKENIGLQDLLFHETGLPGSLNFYKLVVTKKTPQPAATIDPLHHIVLNSNVLEYNKQWVARRPSRDFSLQVSDSFYLHKDLHKAYMQMIANTTLGPKTYLYSCINFVLLKEIAEKITEMPMDKWLRQEFYDPMQLNNMGFMPLQTHKITDITPTLEKDFLRNGPIQGYVHDPAAAFLGGVSGNAGLFANAQDVATLYQMILNNGQWNGRRYLKAETCQLFSTLTSASGRRGLGFDKPVPSKPNNNPCSNLAPQQTYGHTGYTGTCCWVDPVNQIVYVFLSNRTYPNDGVNKLAKMSIRTKIQDEIYNSLK